MYAKIIDIIDNENLNAEWAITRVLDDYEAKMLKVDNEYLKERASDIAEIKHRMLDALSDLSPSFKCQGSRHCQRGRNRIVVAKDLTPSLTVELRASETLGFVTEKGGLTSHAAILARAIGVPAVSGIKGIHNEISCGTMLIIDGNTGEVIVNPAEDDLEEFNRRGRLASPAHIEPPLDGIEVFANINISADVDEALVHMCEGIGLYRTEFEFFAQGRVLTEDEQAALYCSVVRRMEGRPVYFRLLDIGGDKAPAFIEMPAEKNPYLGFRGARFLMERTDLFKAQARALARAAACAPINVIYPMIIDLEQFINLKNRFLEAVKDVLSGVVRHGIMFEVPSACLQAEELMSEADFASVGTNDLIQYLFAVDRNNELVAYDYHPNRDVFWSLLKKLVAAAGSKGKVLSVCGEMAGDPLYVPRLMDIGVKRLSTSARLISQVRLAAKSHSK